MTTDQELCRAHPDDCPNGPELHAYVPPRIGGGQECQIQPPAKPAPTNAYAEATAMAAAYAALEPLDDDARERAMEWIGTRLRAGQTTERYPF